MRAALLLAALAGAACSTDTCRTLTADVGEMCLPDALAPDLQLVIEVRELCGRGCSNLPVRSGGVASCRFPDTSDGGI